MENNLLILIENLEKRFENKLVLKELNFSMKKGDFVTIIGESGSGKTTFLNIVGLLDKKFSGSYIFNNTKVNKKTNLQMLRLNNIGFLFQSFYLIEHLTVKDNILMPLRYSENKIDECYFAQLIAQLNIQNLLEQKCNVLSGGEKQRVALARALITKPYLLICDEPTGNLDKNNRNLVIEMLKTLNIKFGTSIIVVTHDDYIASVGNEKYKLTDGKIKKYN